jgi:protein SCO1/2/putative membrane protein
MTNSKIKRSPKDIGARRRPVWLISGAILWGLAAVALFVVIRHRHRASGASDLESDPQAAAVPLKVDVPTVNTAQSAAPKLASPWDPKGIQDFVFTERSGRKVTKNDLLGHPWLVAFIFTRCAGPCPKVSTQMSALQKEVAGSDVRLVTLTVDPDFDTKDVLDRYAKMYRADPNRWLYLTGDKSKIYELISGSFRMPVKELTGKDREPGYEVLHSTNILLVNEKGVVVKKYNVLDDAEMAALQHDLKPFLRKKPDESVRRNEQTSDVPTKGGGR